MNSDHDQLEDKLDYGALTKALHKACQNNRSLTGMSLQILKEILCEPELDVIPKYLSRKNGSSGHVPLA